MLSHAYTIGINIGLGSPENEKYVVDGLNTTDKIFLTILMTTVQRPGLATNNSRVVIHTTMSNAYISIARELEKIFYTQHVHMT